MFASVAGAEPVARVSFETSAAILSQTSVEQVEKVAASELNTETCLLLQGFISPNPESSYHTFLGRARELEVFRQLVNHGISPQRMAFSSLGITDESGETGSGLRKNYVSIETKVRTDACPSQQAKYVPQSNASPATADKSDVLNIVFAHESGDPEELDLNITAFVAQHAHDGSFRISIEGHSDMQGNDAYNRLLSKLRALKAYQFVVNSGFPGKLVDMNYFGNTKPVVNEKTIAAYRQNRRVSLTWQPVHSDTPSRVAQKIEPASNTLPTPPKIEASHDEDSNGPWEVGLLLGYESAPTEVSSSVKAALQFGAYLRFHLSHSEGLVDAYELRYDRHSHKSQISGVGGSFTAQGGHVGAAKTLEIPYVSPTLHADLGLIKWSAEATEDSTNRTQNDSGTTYGPSLRLGRVFSVGRNFKIEPQLEFEYLAKGLGFSRGILIDLGWRL